MPERVCEHAQRAQRRVHRIQIFNLMEEIAFARGVELTRPRALNQDFQEEGEKIEIFFGGRERERVDLEIPGFEADPNIRAAEKLREAFKAPAQIEDKGVRRVFLKIGDEKIQKEAFAGTRSPKNHGVGDVAVMQVQEVRGVVVGLKDGEILLAEMGIPRLATVKGEEEREIRVVGVEQIQRTQIEDVIAGHRREKGVQKVVLFFVKLGVVHAEDFIEVGARAIHLAHIEFVNHDGERKLAKVIPVQLNLLDAFAQFPDLGFLGIVKQHVLCGTLVQADLAGERALGVVKMAALRLDDPAHLAGVFLFPLGHDVIVRFDFQQPFEDERKALSGGFLKRQDLDVVVVHAQISAVTFDGRFREVIVQEGVVFQLGEFEFVGMKVERSLENAEDLLFIEHPQRDEIADLEDEAADFLQQRRLSIVDMLSKNDGPLLTSKMRLQIRKGYFRIPGQLGYRGSELVGGLKPLVEHHVIHRQRKEGVGFAAEVGDAIFDRGVNDRIVVELIRDRFVVALEEVLVEAIVFVEQLERRLKALGETINRRAIETFVIDAANFEDDAHLTRLGEKSVGTDEAVEIDLLAERAGLVVVLEDSAKPEHGHPFGSLRG